MKVISKIYSSSQARVLIEVEREEDGIRLDEFASSYIKSMSRESLKKMIRSQDIFIDNRFTKNSPHTKVREGDIVKFQYYDNSQDKVDIKSLLLFEDDDLIALNKWKGVLTHPTGRHLTNAISVMIEDYLEDKIYPIHRLDKETSGVLIFAKKKEVATLMRELFDRGEIEKRYWFKSHNLKHQVPDKEMVSLALGADENSTISLKQKVSDSGKEAHTYFEITKECDSFVEGYAFPKTGRLHQIRVHLSHLNAPIVGDEVYGVSPATESLHLECTQMKFIHPIKNKELVINK